MSEFKCKVGAHEFIFKKPPRGATGTTQVSVGTQSIEVSWRRDSQGIWIELPHGVFGYDIVGRLDDDSSIKYDVSRRNAHTQPSSGESWSRLALMREGEESATTAAASGAKKGVRVRAQMPGKILRVDVKQGEQVVKDQPLLVMEAMKMENIIRAPQAGKVGVLKVQAGQAVETGAELCVLDPI